MSEIKVVQILWTPDEATKALANNQANRSIRRSAVSRMAADMAAGLWMESNPQAVSLDPYGAVIDGQHRLAAIVESGRSLLLWTALNVPRNTQLVMDDHTKRQVHDFAQWELPGKKITAQHSATARMMLLGGFQKKRAACSRSIIYHFFRQHYPAIEFSLGAFTKRVPHITQASTFAVLARAWYTQDRAKLRRFTQILETGHAVEEDEGAAVTLSRWMLERGRKQTREQYGKIERALQKFLIAEPLLKVYAAEEELFTIPGEQGSPMAAADTETGGDRESSPSVANSEAQL